MDVVKFDREWDDLTKEERQYLTVLAKKLEAADRAAADAEATLSEAKADLKEAQLDLGIKKFSGPKDDHQIIQNVPEKLDVPGLRADLDTKQWAACTSRTFDSARLQAAVRRGTVPAAIVAKHMAVVPGSPYLKSTARKA